MFGHAASTLAKLDRAADDIERTAASARGIIDGDGRNAVAEVSGAARELKVAIGEARLTIADIGRQTDAIGTRTLPTVNATMQSLQETAESLDALVRQLRPNRSEDRREGKVCGSTCRHWGSPYHIKNKTINTDDTHT